MATFADGVFLLSHMYTIVPGLHRGLAEAPPPLMRPILVELCQPGIYIGLQLRKTSVDPLAEGDPVEFIEDGLMKPLANSIGLRAPHLGLGVLDVLDSQVELIFMVRRLAAKLGSPAGQNTQQSDAMVLIERQNPVVEEVCGSRGLICGRRASH